MKAFGIALLVAVLCLFCAQSGQAQYKGPRSYFPKNYPAPAANGAAATNSAPRAQPAKAQPPKFKDLPVSTGFYFVTDTNRTYLWTKISTTNAKNTKNGVVQVINAETPVQK